MRSKQPRLRLLIVAAAVMLGASTATATVLSRHVIAPAGLRYGKVWCVIGEPVVGSATTPSHTTSLSAGFFMPHGWPRSEVDPGSVVPNAFAFEPVFPNPARGAPTLRFAVPRPARVTIKLYDVQGREVQTLIDAEQQPGIHTVQWNAPRLPSGVYFCRMTGPGFTQSRKLLLLK